MVAAALVHMIEKRHPRALFRAQCRNCTLPIKGHHAIPVISWVWLRGRCRNCRRLIPSIYPVLEMVGGLLFLLVWWKHGEVLLSSWSELIPLARTLVFTAILFAILLFTLFHRAVPKSLTVTTIGVALMLNAVILQGIFDPLTSVVGLVLGMVVLGVFFLLQFLLSKGRWMGRDDIWFGILVGAMFSFTGGVFVLVLAYILAFFVAAVLLASGIAERRIAPTFGTFLAIAGLAVLLTNTQMLSSLL